MATVQLTEENFQSTIEQGIVLLDFWASWCAPCRMFAPIFEEASARHPDVVFGKVDTEAEAALAAAFGVQAVPTLAALRDGILLVAQPGVIPASALDALVRQVKAIDMTEVLRMLSEQESAQPVPDGSGEV